VKMLPGTMLPGTMLPGTMLPSTMLPALAVLLLCTPAATAVKTHFVFWNSTNPMFRLDNTDHIVDVNQGNLPWEYDQLNLVCPQHSAEQHVIYSVSEEEYHGCRVTSQRPKIVAICNKPETFQYVTITFRNFSPTPGGMEFKPGQSYYLISTSTTRDLHRRVGGYCATHNMRMVFKVADNTQQSNSVNENVSEPTSSDELEGPRRSSPFQAMVAPSLAPGPASSTPVYYYRARGQSKDFTYYYSPRDLVRLRKTILSRTAGRDRENETLKAEKLRSSSSVTLSLSIYLVLSLSLSLCFLHF
jgi:hypothetical protein